MENSNRSTFIIHYRNISDLLRQSTVTFSLLAEFARRARRIAGDIGWNGENIHLEPREFITGRKTVSRDLGITEGQYRGAYQKLIKNGLIKTIRTTKRYTIGLYCADNIFNINPEEEQPIELPSEQPTGYQQTATNNNDKKENNVKARLEKLTIYKK